jgi:hypothetical protein
VIRGSGLNVPDISSVSSNLSRLERIGNSLGVTDRASGGVDQPCSGLHFRDQLLVEQTYGKMNEMARSAWMIRSRYWNKTIRTFGPGMKWTIYSHYVALREHIFKGIDASDVDCFGGVFR